MQSDFFLFVFISLIIFLRNPKPFDWYQDYDGVKDIVTQFIKKDSRILNVGCGNSRIKPICFDLFLKIILVMSEIMYVEGYDYIYNIDISKKCISYMQDLCKDYGENFKCFINKII